MVQELHLDASRLGFPVEILTLYESIFLADYALMRHNDPHLQYVKGQDRILLLTSARNAGRAGGHNPARLMDPVVLAYSLIRGLYWLGRGYEWYGQHDKRRPLSVSELTELARRVITSLGCKAGDSSDPGILLGELALCMWKRGLIHFTPCKLDMVKGDVMPYRPLVNWLDAGPGDHLVLKRLSSDVRALVNPSIDLDTIAYRIADLISRVLGLEDSSIVPCFKSLHGLVIRDVYTSKSLPDRYTISDIILLPLVMEPRSPPGARRDRALIPYHMKEYLMRSCGSTGEKLAHALEMALLDSEFKELNDYQWTFIDDYFKSRLSGDRPWGLLTAPTGAGKTLAFVLIVLAEVLAGKCTGNDSLALLVYPRKTLERQQLELLALLISKFNSIIEKIGIRDPRRYSITLMVRDGQSPSIGDLAGNERSHRISLPGVDYEWKHQVRRDGGANVYISSPWWLIDVKVGQDLFSEQGVPLWMLPDIIVTNYSMLYRMIVHDDSNNQALANRVRAGLRILVLDEAHLLVGKDGYTIQAPLLLLKKDYSIIVSSATISTMDIIPGGMSTTHVIAVIPCRTLTMQTPGSILEQVTGLSSSDRSIVYVDYYRDYACKTASKSSDAGMPVIHRKTVWAVISPSAEKKAETAVLEALVSSLHVNAALRSKTGGKYKALAFIESKRSLKDVMSKFTGRFLVESGDVYDRVLLTSRFFDIVKEEYGYSDSEIRTIYKSYKYIVEPLESLLQRCSLSGVIWDLCIHGTYFSEYHNLTPYIDYSTAVLLNAKVAMQNARKTLESIVGAASRVLTQGIGEFWIDTVREQAKAMLERSAWEDDDNTGRYLAEWQGPHLILYHHGDITRYRSLLDAALEEDPTPLLVLATSTLEVGLNLDDVLYTLHYRIPIDNSRIVQEVGRSGRGPGTFYTSLGIVFVRHNAWETPKRIERHAIDYFINVKVPETVALSDNPLALAMLSITIGKDPDSIVQSQASKRAYHMKLLREQVESIIEDTSIHGLRDAYTRNVQTALIRIDELLEGNPDISGRVQGLLKHLSANARMLAKRGRPPYNKGLTPLEVLHIAIETWHLLNTIVFELESTAYSMSMNRELRGAVSIIFRFLEETIALSLQELSRLGDIGIREIREYMLQPSRLRELSFTSRGESPLGVTVLGEP